MDMSIGNFCLVLHGHLPYVLNHGTWPHGEAWLFEAAVETYLPLLGLMDEVACHGVTPNLTIGLTPVLLEQLAHERFKLGLLTYLQERTSRAQHDAREFERSGEAQFAWLARRWERTFERTLEQFERIGRNIPAEFSRLRREGLIDVLTSAATHAYLPLLLDDRSVAAQLAVGAETTRRHLGASATGIWLPECAYRPAWPAWSSPTMNMPTRPRAGLETFLPAHHIDHLFVDAHLFQGATPMNTLDAAGAAQPLRPEDVAPDAHRAARRGWRSPLEAAGVVSAPGRPDVFAFARHPDTSERVWSNKVGYPAHCDYQEFHRKHGPDGLRYWRVTDAHGASDAKQAYDPDDAAARAQEHAADFCVVVEDALERHHAQTGRPGVVVAAFDAELFGHWWAEGPAFLREVLLTLHRRHGSVAVRTTAQTLHDPEARPDKVLRLPEGSWGERGDHRVWVNDQTRWMWDILYRNEQRLIEQVSRAPWRKRDDVACALRRAARELLLLQASDWPFVIRSGGAVDYGIQRFALHATRFDRAMSILAGVCNGVPMSALQVVQRDEIDLHDCIFAELDLASWE